MKDEYLLCLASEEVEWVGSSEEGIGCLVWGCASVTVIGSLSVSSKGSACLLSSGTWNTRVLLIRSLKRLPAVMRANSESPSPFNFFLPDGVVLSLLASSPQPWSPVRRSHRPGLAVSTLKRTVSKSLKTVVALRRNISFGGVSPEAIRKYLSGEKKKKAPSLPNGSTNFYISSLQLLLNYF